MDDTKHKVVTTLVYNRIVKPLSLAHIKSWYEGTILSKGYGDLPLSSQSLSALLEMIGKSDIPQCFSRDLIRNLTTNTALIYDITAISSYSELISIMEYGYNRDGLALPQINLALVVDKRYGIPVMYDIYPGSIVDVATIQNTILKIKSAGIQNFTLILDRGFFSTPNISTLLTNNISFVIPLPVSLKSAKHILSNVHKEIEDPNFLHQYNDEVLFVKPITISLGSLSLKGYLYYDPKRENEERTTFYKRLHNIVERLRNVRLMEWMKPEEVVEEIAGELKQYIEVKVKNFRYEVKIKRNAVLQRINRIGKFILVHSEEFTWDECLSHYRGKDIVEKGFEILKNHIGTLPLNVHKDTTLRGLLFICFLALIVRMRLLKVMQEKKLTEKYSVDSLLLELEKIRKIELSNGEFIVSELTKKQKEILTLLQLCA
ncbi:MAG: IS1634 family transposase [Thermoplasmata archaeon]